MDNHVQSAELRRLASRFMRTNFIEGNSPGSTHSAPRSRSPPISMNQFTRINQSALKPTGRQHGRPPRGHQKTSSMPVALSQFRTSMAKKKVSGQDIWNKSSKTSAVVDPAGIKSAYQVSSGKKHSFFRAEQQHETLVKPWTKEFLSNSRKNSVIDKMGGHVLSKKTINLIKKSGHGHLCNILEEFNHRAESVQLLKASVKGNRYAQDIIGSFDDLRFRKLKKERLSHQKTPSATSPGIVFESTSKAALEKRRPSLKLGVVRGLSEQDPQDARHSSKDVLVSGPNLDDLAAIDILSSPATKLQPNEVDGESSILSTLVDGKAEKEEDDIMAAFDSDCDDRFPPDEQSTMIFDQVTMSWKPADEKGKKEEDDMMAAFDIDSGDDGDAGMTEESVTQKDHPLEKTVPHPDFKDSDIPIEADDFDFGDGSYGFEINLVKRKSGDNLSLNAGITNNFQDGYNAHTSNDRSNFASLDENFDGANENDEDTMADTHSDLSGELVIPVKNKSPDAKLNMVFDSATMSWKPNSEQAIQEEQDLMAGFDDSSDSSGFGTD